MPPIITEYPQFFTATNLLSKVCQHKLKEEALQSLPTLHYYAVGFKPTFNAFNGLNAQAKTFTPVQLGDYKERITYDANGNIKTYSRNGETAASGLLMDNLTYQYERSSNGKLISNKLRYVHDAVQGNSYTEDIKTQTSLSLSQVNADNNSSQSNDNYAYDAIGNLIKDTKEGITNISWTVYGKISSIAKASGAISYTYDASGNRISKTVSGKTTWYVRDASGNVMSLYEAGNSEINNGDLTQTEVHLYGSSRLGILNLKRNVQNPDVNTTGIFNFERGNKFFELSNHLGNVLVTVSDKKIGIDANSDGVIDYYNADVVTANDYAPFGSLLPGRNYNAPSAKDYRYGFNGQEKSNHVTEGNYSAKYWEYDSRISHRWNVDPKAVPSQSPYATFNNNPIWHIDPFGDSSVIDNRGYVVYYDKKDKYLRVFMQQDGKLALVGNLGGTIDANGWFGNLLKDNSKRADDIWNPWTFKNFVKKYGRWDYKNLNESNPRVKSGELKSHILGVAFYRKDKETNPDANPSEDTRFLFNGEKRQGRTYTGDLPRAEDLNNFHFGVVGKATGLFSETTMLKQAGAAEIGKAAEKGQQVPASWRPVTYPHRPPAETDPELGPPYGDNPDDHEWIKRGFKYYNKHRKDLDGDWW